MKPSLHPLSTDFFIKDTVSVAKDLLGKFLVLDLKELLIGKIVETEAYLSNDPANHAFRGETKRNSVMFGEAGKAYVYFIYGSYYCLNVVTGEKGVGEAVLIRALEPIYGIAEMKRNRGVESLEKLSSGPGKLTRAFGIDGTYNGLDLREGKLKIMAGENGREEIFVSERVGLKEEKPLKLRFCLESKFVSRKW